MVLRCSLLGHDYGETEVEREREERGSEVVVTVVEYEECARCGERTVISENTEVTSISARVNDDALPNEFELESETTATGTDAVETAPDPASAPAATDAADTADTADTADAEFRDDGNDETEFVVIDSHDETDDEIEIPTDEDGEPITDDGEILEDDGTAGGRDRDRGHGEWPESDDVGPPVGAENEPVEWPDSGDDAAADSAAETEVTDSLGGGFEDDVEAESDGQITDDAIVLENDSSGPSESPAAADARSVTAGTSTAADTANVNRTVTGTGSTNDSGSGIERAATAPTPGQSGGTARDDVPTEFYCPRCEFVASSDRGSLRAGDICPECRKGYIGERALE